VTPCVGPAVPPNFHRSFHIPFFGEFVPPPPVALLLVARRQQQDHGRFDGESSAEDASFCPLVACRNPDVTGTWLRFFFFALSAWHLVLLIFFLLSGYLFSSAVVLGAPAPLCVISILFFFPSRAELAVPASPNRLRLSELLLCNCVKGSPSFFFIFGWISMAFFSP